jgi:hypothetical protein
MSAKIAEQRQFESQDAGEGLEGRVRRFRNNIVLQEEELRRLSGERRVREE